MSIARRSWKPEWNTSPGVLSSGTVVPCVEKSLLIGIVAPGRFELPSPAPKAGILTAGRRGSDELARPGSNGGREGQNLP